MRPENSPFLVYTAKVIAAWDIGRQTGNRLKMRGSIPPWEYKIHRISSISGWYSALSLDVSETFEVELAPPSSSGESRDTTPLKIGSRGSGGSAVCF